MAGQLLTSGNPQNYSAIGEAGQPIYSVAFQLREAVRLKAGADVANCLAIPQRNDQGSVIDWYAPERGDIVPWSAATPEEREHALVMLDAAQRKLDEAVRQIEGTEARSEQAIREKNTVLPLLGKVFFFPDSNFIFLVNGKPVVTFWGFNAQGATLPTDPFVSLRPVMAAPAVMQAAAPTKRRAWWWWLLLLSLFLLLLLLLLRSCGAPPWLVQAVPILEPLQSTPDFALGPRSSTGVPPAPLCPNNKPDAGLEQRVAVPGRVDVQTESTTVITNCGQSLTPGVTPSPTAIEPSATETQPSANPSIAPDTSTPAPGTSGQPGNPMLIPDAALNSGSTRFLEGSWSAGAGIQDATTG